MNLFISYLWTDSRFYLSIIVIIIFSISIHELAHVYTAMREGDFSAANAGYYTLNPLVLMGATSIILLMIFGFAWGAVPVQPSRMRRKHSHLIVSCAGPISNLILAMVFSFIYSILLIILNNSESPAISFFALGTILNCGLFILNMLPVPIFDGWKLYETVIPKLQNISQEHRSSITFFAIMAFMLIPKIFTYLIVYSQKLATIIAIPAELIVKFISKIIHNIF